MKELTDAQVATAFGWRDIKSWGGRGIRGLRPGADRHECLPMFTSRLGDIARALDAKGIGWAVGNNLRSKTENKHWAQVEDRNPVSNSYTPALALCAASLAYLKDQGSQG